LQTKLYLTRNQLQENTQATPAQIIGTSKGILEKRCIIRSTKFGDDNSKLFHNMATKRYRRNSIASLTLEDGSIVSEHKDKEKIIFEA
jgi:hypothetical protein